jgi:hypothetical protein
MAVDLQIERREDGSTVIRAAVLAIPQADAAGPPPAHVICVEPARAEAA